MKKLLLIIFVLLTYSGYSQNKLYKSNSVVITATKITYPGGITPFLIDTTGKPDYTDFSSIENWSLYGGETSLTAKQVKDEIDSLVVAKTFAACTDSEKDVASEWFVVDKADRDTRHTASQQEINAERLVRDLFFGFSERDIIACRNNIKDADKTTIDNVINSQLSPSVQLKTGIYTGDGTTSIGVTGIGFSPKYLIIWEQSTVDATSIAIWETTDVIIDDLTDGAAIDLGGATPVVRDNHIISLDVDGFTVDDNALDEHPNKLNTVYSYLAIR